MNEINPELTTIPVAGGSSVPPERDSSFLDGVERLFGTRDTNVAKAVAAFLEKGPGDLDHHCLRLIAASASHFDDKNHVAYMINRLPVSQMNIAARSIDVETIRERLGVVLPHYRPSTSRKLVLDLVDKSMLQVLENSPIQHVPEPGREIVRAELRRRLRGTRDDRFLALSSELITPDVVSRALDNVEERIDRLDAVDDSSTERVDMSVVANALGEVLRARTESQVSDDNLQRAWGLFRRIEDSDEIADDQDELMGLWIFNQRLIAMAGNDILDAIETRAERDEDYWLEADRDRGYLLTASSLDEETALRAVNSGAIPPANVVDQRLSAIRLAHYSTSSDLLPPMSIDEIDRRFAELPVEYIALPSIALVEDPEAITTLIRRVDELSDNAFAELVKNPTLRSEQMDPIVDRIRTTELTPTAIGRRLPSRAGSLLSSPQLNDEQLNAIITSVQTATTDSDTIAHSVGLAAHNPRAGERVLEKLLEITDSMSDGRTRLALVAQDTSSVEVQDALTRRSIERNDAELAGALSRNGRLRTGRWQAIREAFWDLPQLDDRQMGAMISSNRRTLASDNLAAVTALAISGDVPADRFAAVLSRREPLNVNDYIEMIGQMMDSGNVPAEVVETGMADGNLHVALAFAAHPRARRDTSSIRLAGEISITDTYVAVDRGIPLPPDRRLNTWDQLPNLDDLPFTRTRLHELIDGREIDGRVLYIPVDPRGLKSLSRSMSNCLDRYVEPVSLGTDLVAAADDGNETYAVLWRLTARETSDASPSTPEIEIVEVNSKRNTDEVPEWFRSGVEEMTYEVNDITARPVDQTPPSIDEGRGGSSVPFRRPRPRRAVARLTSADEIDGTSQPASPAPSLLARSDEHEMASVVDEPTAHDVPDTHVDKSPDLGHQL